MNGVIRPLATQNAHNPTLFSFPLAATVTSPQLTLPMLRLLSSNAQVAKIFEKPSKPCHYGIHWIALAEPSEISTIVPGFQTIFSFFASFCIG